jgi:hypothetical protein
VQAGERSTTQPTDFRYDTVLIKDETERLLAAYLGRPGKVSGSRLVWDCPKCSKPKLSLLRAKGAVGCMNAGCEVETNTDVIGVIASLEGLKTRGEDFKRVCALCYSLLSIPDSNAAVETPRGRNSPPPSPNGSAAGEAARAPHDAPYPDHETFTPASPDFVDAVFFRLLQLCPLEDRDVRFLASRGIAEETARFGRFGSISAPRARHATDVLGREFSREELLGVPGFRVRKEGGKLGFTLWGDFLLIPYFDRAGRVVTLEGRAVGKVPSWAGKYTALRNAGNHLYVFPSFAVDELVAICEGPMGSIVAAQEGLPVGAIQGVKRYTRAGEDAPLPELASTDFGRRTVLYVPDLDVKPDARTDVEAHAPRACESLISRQNGRAMVATVPQEQRASGDPVKDLDAWILSAPEAGPYGLLGRLRSRALSPEEWAGLPEPGAELRPETAAGASPASQQWDPREEGEIVSEIEAPRGSGDDRGAGPGAPEDAFEDDAKETSGQESGEDGADAAETAELEPQLLDAYDRWYAVLEGYPGSAELAARPQAYTPRATASPVPGGVFVEEGEVQWACLFALCAALVFWYYVGASDGWLAGGLGFLPSLPGPLPALYGIPFALLFGVAVGVLLLAHLRGRRLAARRHLLGGGRRQ